MSQWLMSLTKLAIISGRQQRTSLNSSEILVQTTPAMLWSDSLSPFHLYSLFRFPCVSYFLSLLPSLWCWRSSKPIQSWQTIYPVVVVSLPFGSSLVSVKYDTGWHSLSVGSLEHGWRRFSMTRIPLSVSSWDGSFCYPLFSFSFSLYSSSSSPSLHCFS